VREFGSVEQGDQREWHMKTSIQNPNLSATDATPIKHGRRQEFEQETEGTEPGRIWKGRGNEKWQEAVGIQIFCRISPCFYRLATASCRLVTEIYHLATGCYRIISQIYRVLPRKSTQVVDFPHLARVKPFWEGVENSRIAVRVMIVRRMGPNGAWNRGVGQAQRKPSYWLVRIVTRSFTKVRTDQARKSSIVRIVTGANLF